MRYATVCSGVEACTVAWHGLGWQPVFFSQFEPEHDYNTGPDFPSKVLKHHYPNVPNLGDMNLINGNEYNGIDLICGGTPCQSFSVAGLRKGMSDPRGNLALVFLRLVDQIRPRWIVWENVPGVLTSNKGRDFGAFLGALSELGYGWAYRVLDAQYFGVPQRRRRVFVVGHIAGEQYRAASVLFEPERSSRNFTPQRKRPAGKSAFGAGVDAGQWPKVIAPTLDCSFAEKHGQDNQHIKNGAGLFVPFTMATGQSGAEIMTDKAPTLTCNHEAPLLFNYMSTQSQGVRPSGISQTLDVAKAGGLCVFDPAQIGNKTHRNSGKETNVCPTLHTAGPFAFFAYQNKAQGIKQVDVANTVLANPSTDERSNAAYCVHQKSAQQGYLIRRLTPVECERLQGFPDNYTAISGAKTPDSPRYKAMGNSMAVPVMRWIGERIAMIDKLK